MRLPCPICGTRDRREFYYQGAASMLERPVSGELDAWHAYVHVRDNPAGRTRDLWHHEAGCGAWVIVERDTVTHEVFGAVLVEDADAD
ncbi:sarcosine oxidase subunit delta [Tropicibacter naphthalenivorans]|uniref:Sarcosine oxidase, delta subunit family n=1 Tax=Tropicibacter naphthalenivorans TaxID=441103 RepID=A0A0N7LZJ7_9RHOB|nr:sarcosine oxidase subunit delta [Tropicibacter naphthalenivorans]CUH77857.1 sarcosine oxidase, delta subunit family [Tropicibacter naphthalenivorans]SMC95369.1 sarcosine oxidase subunit delta [Tropicibacter naphthalenivorans]